MKRYCKSIFYVLIMVINIILGYLFLDRGFNTISINRVRYENNNKIDYTVNYKNQDNIVDDNNEYVSSDIDNILVKYNYNKKFDRYINGYYRYNIHGYLVGYDGDVKNILWKREYLINDDITSTINKGDTNFINIGDEFKLDYSKYRKYIYDYMDENDVKIGGYFHVIINVYNNNIFEDINKRYDNLDVITLDIPLTEDIISIDYNLNNGKRYYEFTEETDMKIVFLLIGSFFVALSVSSLVFVIINGIAIIGDENWYKKSIDRLISRNKDILVYDDNLRINKKYRLNELKNFKELYDMAIDMNVKIRYREIKKDVETIFVITDNKDIYLYRKRIDN